VPVIVVVVVVVVRGRRGLLLRRRRRRRRRSGGGLLVLLLLHHRLGRLVAVGILSFSRGRRYARWRAHMLLLLVSWRGRGDAVGRERETSREKERALLLLLCRQKRRALSLAWEEQSPTARDGDRPRGCGWAARVAVCSSGFCVWERETDGGRVL
jgi:hypothetical protein